MEDLHVAPMILQVLGHKPAMQRPVSFRELARQTMRFKSGTKDSSFTLAGYYSATQITTRNSLAGHLEFVEAENEAG